MNLTDNIDGSNDPKNLPESISVQHLQQKKHNCSIICPSYEYLIGLSINTDLICTVPNCDEIFSNSSALNLHLEKVHRLNQNIKVDDILVTKARSRSQKLAENCECKYYCPIESCKFHISNKSNKYLPTFHSIKVHFIRIHGNKLFKCSKCEKCFSIKSEKERHESNCCKLHVCFTCKINYSTHQSLLKHCRKKGHLANQQDKYINNRRVSTKQPSLTNDFTVTPCQILFIKDSSSLNNFIILPAQSVIDSKKLEPNNINDTNQRSFGCQTINSISTQETGSQTLTATCSTSIVDSINLNQIPTFNTSTSPLNFDLLNNSTMNLNNRETQTFRSFNNNETNTNYDYLDATTSTYLDNIFDPLNDKFTQTYQPNNLTTTSTNTQLDDCIYSQEFLFESNPQNYKISFSQNNRCTTPTNVETDSSQLYGSFSISCQTENANANLYQDNINNTIDTITQTDWVFNENLK